MPTILRYIEPPLGVIPEQGACPLRPKGARSKAKNKKGARSRKRVIQEQGAEFFQAKKEHGEEKEHCIDNPGAWEKWKKEQGAKKNEKGAKKKGKGSKGGNSKRSGEQGGKM